MGDIARFWSKVQRGTPAECWPWVGQICRGKATFSIGDTTISARKFV